MHQAVTAAVALLLAGCHLETWSAGYHLSGLAPHPAEGSGVEVTGTLDVPDFTATCLCLTIRNTSADTVAIVWDSTQFRGVDGDVDRLVPGNLPFPETRLPEDLTRIPPGGLYQRSVSPAAKGKHASLDCSGRLSTNGTTYSSALWLLPWSHFRLNGSQEEATKHAEGLVGRTLRFVIPLLEGDTLVRHQFAFRIDSFELSRYTDI
jgi:hypothetical protein